VGLLTQIRKLERITTLNKYIRSCVSATVNQSSLYVISSSALPILSPWIRNSIPCVIALEVGGKHRESCIYSRNFDKRESLQNGRFSVRFDLLHRQNLQRSAGLPCKREMYTDF
jgi:hypothetical protein